MGLATWPVCPLQKVVLVSVLVLWYYEIKLMRLLHLALSTSSSHCVACMCHPTPALAQFSMEACLPIKLLFLAEFCTGWQGCQAFITHSHLVGQRTFWVLLLKCAFGASPYIAGCNIGPLEYQPRRNGKVFVRFFPGIATIHIGKVHWHLKSSTAIGARMQEGSLFPFAITCEQKGILPGTSWENALELANGHVHYGGSSK
ncbi:unnamed protein product [Ostreobium quekettii]|uniref:Uncharacterized protein n=1 Tax=Ostreobium quekettii TaxID=121088 RepID=A0A8S1JBC0_9CHLO|nr:unnamed protein product [Ostreobium quekettii]